MGEPQALLSMDTPAVDICWLSHLPASAFAKFGQCWKRGDPEIFPERVLGFNKEQQSELTAPTKACWMCKAGSQEYPKLKASPRTRFSISVEKNQGVWRACDINFVTKWPLASCQSKPQSDQTYKILSVTIMPCQIASCFKDYPSVVEKLHKKHAEWTAN